MVGIFWLLISMSNVYVLSLLISKIFALPLHTIFDYYFFGILNLSALMSDSKKIYTTIFYTLRTHWSFYAERYTHVPNFQLINGEETKIFNKLFIFHTLWYKWCISIWSFHSSVAYDIFIFIIIYLVTCTSVKEAGRLHLCLCSVVHRWQNSHKWNCNWIVMQIFLSTVL